MKQTALAFDTATTIALANEETHFECDLWECLRDRGLRGFQFARAVTIGPYIVDYLCHEARLIIELDGLESLDRGTYDLLRTRQLEKLGFRVLRFWNSHVSENLSGVLSEIEAHLRRPS